MKRLSLLLGALGGGLAGYLFSNKKLREDLTKAKDPEQAARLLGKHLQQDGKKLAGQVREFIESDEVQKSVDKAKKAAKQTLEDAKKELKKTTERGKKAASKQMHAGMETAKSKISKATGNAKKRMKKTSSRVRTTTRALNK
ncbi:MAG: hypothetical protein WCX29_00675 [Candidatus Peribacteraceae bacterium]|jgi:F0F1-type ATP synthase membrane subunit b/b'